MNKLKLKNNNSKLTTAAIIISAVFLICANAEAASFNYGPQDPQTLRVSNYSRNPGCATCWSGNVSASAGQIISFMIYYHNTASDTAINTRLRVNLPSHSFTSTSITGGVEADNSTGAGGSVNVFIPSNQSLTFIPGSFRWYPNQSSNPQSAPAGQNESDIVSSGLNIGSIAGGWASQGYAVFQVQISSNQQEQTPAPVAPTYDYNQNYYSPSYVPVYVPTYNPAPTYAAPEPAPVFQTKPVQVPVSKPAIFQRSEDKLEFEIYLDKEKSLVGDENILFARYYNAGGSAAKNATLHITLPDGVEFLKFTATPAVMRDGNLFEYNIGTVNPGEEKIIPLNFLVGEQIVPGNNLQFEGKLSYAGSKGTLKSIQDSTVLEVTTANQLTASAYSIIGPILNSWIRQLIIGILIGLFIYHWFFSEKKKEPLTFK